MKKLMYLVMAIAMSLFAADASAQYIPVTASSCIVDGSGSTITSGTLIVVGTDSNDNPVVYRAGTTFITTTAPITKTITAGSVPSFQLADPSSSSPLNVSYRFVVQDNTTKKITVYKGINITPNDVLSGGVFTTFNICKMNPGAGVASFGGFTTPSLVSGDWTVTRDLIVGRNASITGTFGVTGLSTLGAITAFKINGICWVDGIKYTTIMAAYNDTANCNAVHVPTLGSSCYTETMTADWVLNRSSVPIVFEGCTNITQNGFRVTAPSGTNNISILSPFAHSSNTAGSNLGVSFQGYNGALGAFDFGDTSGFVNNLRITGINVGMSSALANATAFRMTNVEQSAFDDIGCIHGPVSGHACYRSIGTGAFFAGLNRIMSIDCEAPLLATNNFCIQLGTISNDNTIIGGHANILGSGANNSVCIDVSGSTSGNNKVFGFDCDTGVTGLTVESTSSNAMYAILNVDSGVTNSANFGTNSLGNTLYVTGNLPFVDNGVAGTNSVINPARNNFRTDIWQNQVQATFSFFYKDLLDSGSDRLTLVNGPAGDTRLNAGSGAGLIKLAWEQGTGGIDFGNGAGASSGASVSSAGVNTTKGITISGKSVLISAIAPTISSGFGTSPSIVSNNGPGSFTVNVGTGGTATNGVIGLPTATNGWNCTCEDQTTRSTTVGFCRQTANTTTSATVGNFNTSLAAAAWVASDVLIVSCLAR